VTFVKLTILFQTNSLFFIFGYCVTSALVIVFSIIVVICDCLCGSRFVPRDVFSIPLWQKKKLDRLEVILLYYFTFLILILCILD